MRTLLAIAALLLAVQARGATYFLISQTNAFAAGITNKAKLYTDSVTNTAVANATNTAKLYTDAHTNVITRAAVTNALAFPGVLGDILLGNGNWGIIPFTNLTNGLAAPNDTGVFLNGKGLWSTPPGSAVYEITNYFLSITDPNIVVTTNVTDTNVTWSVSLANPLALTDVTVGAIYASNLVANTLAGFGATTNLTNITISADFGLSGTTLSLAEAAFSYTRTTNALGLTGSTTTFVRSDGTQAEPPGGAAIVGTVSNAVAQAGLLAVDSTKTNGIAATLAHITNAFGIFNGASGDYVGGDAAMHTLPASTGFSTNVATHEGLSLMTLVNEFMNPGTSGPEWSESVANSASISASSAETNHPGVASFSTGSQANGAAYTVCSATAMAFGGGASYAEFILKTGANLTDLTEVYWIRAGFNDSSTGSATDGAYFRYSTNSLNWYAIVRGSSSETAADTGLVVDANTWYRLGVLVNTDASTVTFLTNGVAACSISDANIPTTTELTRPCVSIAKTEGTTARNMLVDYARVWKVISR